MTGQEGETTYSGVVCDLEKPFALKANFEPWWEMNIDLTPASIKTGAYTLAGAMYDGSATFAGEGTYTISPANEGAHQLTLKCTSGMSLRHVAIALPAGGLLFCPPVPILTGY